MNFKIRLVPRDQVDTVWSDAGKLIEPSLDISPGRFTIDDIHGFLDRGVTSLWVVEDNIEIVAAVVTKLHEIPRSKVCSIEWGGGQKLDIWADDFFEVIEKYATDSGCHRIEDHGKIDWGKRLKQNGWHFFSINCEKEL